MEEKEVLDLKEFLPDVIYSGKEKRIIPVVDIFEKNIKISYNSGWRNLLNYSSLFSRYIPKNEHSFEVLGLLQAEMGKTQNGTLSFSNHEYGIINSVMEWFKKEFNFPFEQ